MHFKLLATVLGLVVATTAQGVTTRLDNEYFAFEQARPFAFHTSGKWVSAPITFSLRVSGNNFVVDTRSASSIIPPACRAVYTSELPTSTESFTPPRSVLGGAPLQNLMFWGEKCHVKLWMTAEIDPFFSVFNDLLPPNNTKSASQGIIEFASKNSDEITSIEFAVLVEDIPVKQKADN